MVKDELQSKTLQLMESLELELDPELKSELLKRTLRTISETLENPVNKWEEILLDKSKDIKNWINGYLVEKRFSEYLGLEEPLEWLGETSLRDYISEVFSSKEINWESTYPLAGIRVLKPTQYIRGSKLAACLSELGAEVITVDAPRKRKIKKHEVPYEMESLFPDSRWIPNRGLGLGAFLKNVRRYFISIDLNVDEGKEALNSLIKESEMIVWNLRPGTFAKWGFSFDSAKGINSNISQLWERGYSRYDKMSEYYNFNILGEFEDGYLSITSLLDEDLSKPLNWMSELSDNEMSHYLRFTSDKEIEKFEFLWLDEPSYKEMKKEGLLCRMSNKYRRIKWELKPVGADNEYIYRNLLGFSRKQMQELTEI